MNRRMIYIQVHLMVLKWIHFVILLPLRSIVFSLLCLLINSRKILWLFPEDYEDLCWLFLQHSKCLVADYINCDKISTV